MEMNLLQYFKDGITIDKLHNGKYSIFTIKTQRFTVNSLEELTPESFEKAITALEEREKLTAEAMSEFQKNIDTPVLEGIPIENLTYDYFKLIAESPKTSEVIFGNGESIPVGDKYQMSLNDGRVYDVYIHSVYKVSKFPDNNLVIIIFEKDKRMETLSVKTIKNNVKEFKLL